MRCIGAERVREIRRSYDCAAGYERDAFEAQLDAIENGRRFEGLTISVDNSVDRDEALQSLAGFGAPSLTEYMYGETFGSGWSGASRVRDYQSGLRALGIPYDDAERISGSLERGEIPADVMDVVAQEASRIGMLHPDKYPWDASAFDGISDGLTTSGINTEKIWQGVSRYFASKHKQRTPGQCIEGSARGAIVNFFEIYALAIYHDVKNLDSSKREVRF